MKTRVAWIVSFMLAASLQPAVTQTKAGSAAAPVRSRSDINMFLELHSQLLLAASSSESAMPEYRSEVLAYKEARELSKDPSVWRLVTDACVVGPDIGAIGQAAGRLPQSLAPADLQAAKKALEALVSAWPRFEAQDLDAHRRSLQLILTRVVRRMYEQLHMPRLMEGLHDRMMFKPIDAPVTIYPVLSAVEAGVWGRTTAGYYLVIPVGRLPQLIVIENIVHEMTHMIDANQPEGWRDLLVRIREKAAGADAETLDAFLHGLVSWNAGEFIRRFVNADHKTYFDLSPDRRARIERFVPAYQESWIPWMDGKITVDQVVDRLGAAAKAARPAPAPPATPGS